MKIFIFIILFLFSGNLFSQNLIKGKVVDAQSRQPLESVIVSSAQSPSLVTTTDQNGDFTLKSSNKLLLTYIGYKSASLIVEKYEGNIIALEPAVISLNELVLEKNKILKFNVISKIDLAVKPVNNTQELLRIVPGLFIAQHAGGGKAEQIFLRGFDCDHGTDIQVSVDGIPVNMVSHAHGQGYADAHFIIPETVNSIDFAPGPYDVNHGNLNTAGYVSFKTFKSIPKSTFQIEGGRFNSFRTLVMLDLLKKNKDKQSAYVAAEYNYTDGPTLNPQNFNRLNIFGKYNLQISNITEMILSLSTFKSSWNASGQVPTRAVESGTIDRFGSIDPSEGGNTERHNLNLVFKHQLKSSNNIEQQFFYSRYKFNLYSNFSFFLRDSINGDGINQAEDRVLYGYGFKLNKKYYLEDKVINSSYGVGFRNDATTDSRLSNVTNRIWLNDVKLGNINETNVYAFTQQELSTGKWLLNAGLRLDYFNFNYLDKLSITNLPSQQKAILSPKLNAMYSLNQQVQLFAKAGKGFHSNDTRVVVANKGEEILPAAFGTDIGVNIKPVKNLFLSIAVWNLYLNQEFVYVGDEGNIEPSGKTKRMGLDITARYQFSRNLFANANINFTSAKSIEQMKGEDYIPLAPSLTSVGGLYYKKQQGFNGGLSYRYIKNRPANEDNSIVAKGYFLLDGTINFTKPTYEIGLSFENVFNAKWNEAQFATESRLQNEPMSQTELNFTPGTPLFAKLKFALYF